VGRTMMGRRGANESTQTVATVRPVGLDGLHQPQMLTSGDLGRLVHQDGVTGLTSNPAIFEKAIDESADYDSDLRKLLDADASIQAPAIYEKLSVDDIRMAADRVRIAPESSVSPGIGLCPMAKAVPARMKSVSPSFGQDASKKSSESRVSEKGSLAAAPPAMFPDVLPLRRTHNHRSWPATETGARRGSVAALWCQDSFR